MQLKKHIIRCVLENSNSSIQTKILHLHEYQTKETATTEMPTRPVERHKLHENEEKNFLTPSLPRFIHGQTRTHNSGSHHASMEVCLYRG
jgi:hypothetical protein